MDNPAVSNVFGTAGAICWSIQLLPQILKNYRHHSTEGLHPIMYSSWAVAGIPLGVYNLVQNLNIALQIQPHILIFLSLVTWSQCKYYGDNWTLNRILGAFLGFILAIGGIEVGLFFALRYAWDKRGLEWPMTLMAVLAAVFLAVGGLRYYWEIYKARDVKGVSFIFVSIDYAGDLTSIVALVFAPRLDIVGIVIYAVEGLLWTGMLLLGVHYRLIPFLLRAWRKATRKTPSNQSSQ